MDALRDDLITHEVVLFPLNVGCSKCGETAEIALVVIDDSGHTLEIIMTACSKHRASEVPSDVRA